MSRSKKLIVTALFLIGACILLYPAVSNKLAERHQAEMISRYEQTVEELPKTDMKSEWEKAVKYNESVTGMSVEDPFILGSGSVLPGNYKDVLNVEEKEGVMGYIVYCKIVYRFGSNEGRGFVLYPCIGSSSYL